MAQTLPGINVLLMGQPGSGKTHALSTLLDCDLEVFALFTEPGMETILSALSKHPSVSRFHWSYIPPAAPDFTALLDNARKINTLSQSVLQKMDGLNRNEYGQFIEVVQALHNFTDQHGKEWGDISTWDGSRAFILDSLSGLNIMAMDLVTGAKPIKSMPDWGMAMDNLGRLIQKLCGDTMCHFILTSHLEMERDEISGRVEATVATLGRKLAPSLPRFFSDVILCEREGDTFTWNTAAANASTKARNLPIAGKQRPSFVPLIQKWRSNAAVGAAPSA